MSPWRAACACSSRCGGGRAHSQHRRDVLDFGSGALPERDTRSLVPVARVIEVAFDKVHEAVHAEGELVAHGHHDRVRLVPFLSAQVSKRPAVVRLDFHRVRTSSARPGGACCLRRRFHELGLLEVSRYPGFQELHQSGVHELKVIRNIQADDALFLQVGSKLPG